MQCSTNTEEVIIARFFVMAPDSEKARIDLSLFWMTGKTRNKNFSACQALLHYEPIIGICLTVYKNEKKKIYRIK